MTPEQLREVQKALGLSVPKFADRLGCSQSLLDKIYRGTRRLTPVMEIMVIGILDKEIKSGNGDKSLLLSLHKRITSGTV